jgi:hypothetical protein
MSEDVLEPEWLHEWDVVLVLMSAKELALA